MRNIKHHCVIITTHNIDVIKKIREKVLELFKLNMEAGNAYKLVGEPVESLINNYYTLVIYPDGSKEGHETSEDGDIVRKKVTEVVDEFIKSSKDADISYVELYYGSDDGKAGIVRNV